MHGIAGVGGTHTSSCNWNWFYILNDSKVRHWGRDGCVAKACLLIVAMVAGGRRDPFCGGRPQKFLSGASVVKCKIAAAKMTNDRKKVN